MDLIGLSAVIASLSGLVVAATGTVVALRVGARGGESTTTSKPTQEVISGLPRQSAKPADSLANERIG